MAAPAAGAGYAAGTVLLAQVADNIGGYVSEWGRDLVIAGAILLAWRILRAAQVEAVERYKQNAAEADSKLDAERAEWHEERARLQREIDTLRSELREVRHELDELRGRRNNP